MNVLDKCILQCDALLQTLFPASTPRMQRPSPGDAYPESMQLCAEDKRHIAGLMRVNHAGEVCAQALYQGQGFTAKTDAMQAQMMQAAEEERDHLAWCEMRLDELGSRTSMLNLLWYVGSFVLGATAGLLGDTVSLGFVAETERQVAMHLQSHLEKIPEHDKRTQAIMEQMQLDEAVHEAQARRAGAMDFPPWVQALMRMTARLMTTSSYYV